MGQHNATVLWCSLAQRKRRWYGEGRRLEMDGGRDGKVHRVERMKQSVKE